MDSNDERNALNIQIQYKMIEKLSEMNAQLEKEVLEKRKAEQKLIKINQELEKALQAKSDFLSTMSHEMRTPLNIILGYTQLMLKHKPQKEKLGEVKSIKIAANNLLNIVDQIFQYLSLEEENISILEEAINIHSLRNKYLTIFKEKAFEKSLNFNIDIDTEIPINLLGDKEKLHQIINNILSNAFKYTESGRINLSIQIKNNIAKLYWVKFVISDTGIGMNKQEVQTIFEGFKQAQTDITRKYGGIGLGLAICKKLISLMNGSIFVNSNKNKGSTFTFVIPFKKTTAVQKEKEAAPKEETLINKDKPLKGVNVLLAEDDLFNQVLALKVLEDVGCKVTTAENGKEAVNISSKEEFDVILMDLHMPILDGFKAAQKIIATNNKTPIIGFSADVLNETKKKVHDIGMQTLITKPFIINELVQKIRKVI